ncbi:MAG: HD domain-containing protein [Deltaproteobacteria bacterium]|nr:HD domain-containing protein [Deltaproteobacteria bacterium]
MSYRIAVFTEETDIRNRISKEGLSEFQFFVSDKLSEFVSIIRTFKPDAILIDDSFMSSSPESLLGTTIVERLQLVLVIILIYSEVERLLESKWVKYARDVIRRDELFLPLLEKRLINHIETQRLRLKVLELETVLEHKREVIKDFEELLLDILDLRVPGIKERALLSREIAEYLSQKIGLSEEEKEELVLAALLREIGKIGLPEEALNVKEDDIMSEKIRLHRSHALIGKKILSCLKVCPNVATLVGEQYERFDGEGFPQGLRGNQMSVKALILQAITFYEEQLTRGFDREAILDSIHSASRRILEPTIASYIAEYVLDKEIKLNGTILKVPIHELKPGMVIAEDLYSVNGTKILSKGSKITEHILMIIDERKNVDPIIGSVYVYK